MAKKVLPPSLVGLPGFQSKAFAGGWVDRPNSFPGDSCPHADAGVSVGVVQPLEVSLNVHGSSSGGRCGTDAAATGVVDPRGALELDMLNRPAASQTVVLSGFVNPECQMSVLYFGTCPVAVTMK